MVFAELNTFGDSWKMKTQRNDCYLYEHVRTDTGEVIYVGKGCDRRAWNMNNRSKKYLDLIAELKKLGIKIDVRIVCSGLSDDEAYQKEIALIAKHRSEGSPLANVAKGGGKGGGYVMPDEWRKKISAAKKGKPVPALRGRKMSDANKKRLSEVHTGKKLTDWHRRKLSESQQRRWENQEARDRMAAVKIGFKQPQSAIDKLRVHTTMMMSDPTHLDKVKKGVKAAWDDPEKRARIVAAQIEAAERKKKPLVCLDDGRRFPSANEASEFYGVERRNISAVCIGKRKRAGKLRFAYVEAA